MVDIELEVLRELVDDCLLAAVVADSQFGELDRVHCDLGRAGRADASVAKLAVVLFGVENSDLAELGLADDAVLVGFVGDRVLAELQGVVEVGCVHRLGEGAAHTFAV